MSPRLGELKEAVTRRYQTSTRAITRQRHCGNDPPSHSLNSLAECVIQYPGPNCPIADNRLRMTSSTLLLARLTRWLWPASPATTCTTKSVIAYSEATYVRPLLGHSSPAASAHSPLCRTRLLSVSRHSWSIQSSFSTEISLWKSDASNCATFPLSSTS